MKKLLVFLLLAPYSSLFAQTAKIKIDIERTIGEIDPKIYGVFMEPIQFSGRRLGLPDSTSFNTMYGIGDPSPLANKMGLRKDYIEQ
jgi:alpha-N-arabinofuranosidase